MRREKDTWVFSSGRRRYAHSENLGLTQDTSGWEIAYGYDGRFWSQWDREDYIDDDDRKLTQSDLLEMAEHQLNLWKDFRDWLSSQPNSGPYHE